MPTVYNQDNKQTYNKTGEIKAPHRRRGHFRVLRNERYTNKKNEIVYVKPCFIHGGSTEDKLYVARKV